MGKKKKSKTEPVGKPSSLIDTRVIYCGDNLDQLKKFPDGCVDLIYIDPADGKFENPLSLHKYLYCTNDPINRWDPLGLWTAHVNLSAMASFVGSVMASVGFVIDDQGNFGTMWTTNWIYDENGKMDKYPVGWGTPFIGFGVYGGLTNAKTIYDLEGPGVSGGGSYGSFPLYLTGYSVNYLKGSSYKGWEFSPPFLNYGFAPEFELHEHRTTTVIDPISNNAWYEIKRALEETAPLIRAIGESIVPVDQGEYGF